jgi:hypothetical protein
MNEWISVKDGLPEFGCPVLVSDGQSIYVATRYQHYEEFIWKISCDCCDVEYHYGFEVTHWMTLPNLPIKEQHDITAK